MRDRNTDREKKIAEIREALENATPGPWKVKKGERWTEDYPRETYIQAVWDKPDHRGCVGYRVAKMSGVHGKTMRDAHLIANAPEWLRFLLELFDEAKKDAEFWKNEYEKGVKRVAFLGDSFERLRQERDKLIEGLKFYANEDNWRSTRFVVGRAEADSGQTAQAILDEIGVAVE